MNVPQYKIELPSTGEQINMRPYLVKEEKVLMIALESKNNVVNFYSFWLQVL